MHARNSCSQRIRTSRFVLPLAALPHLARPPTHVVCPPTHLPPSPHLVCRDARRRLCRHTQRQHQRRRHHTRARQQQQCVAWHAATVRSPHRVCRRLSILQAHAPGRRGALKCDAGKCDADKCDAGKSAPASVTLASVTLANVTPASVTPATACVCVCGCLCAGACVRQGVLLADKGGGLWCAFKVGVTLKDAVPRALQGPQGVLVTGDSGVREAFTNHFETLLGGESDICETAMQWLRQAAAGRQIYAELAEGYGSPPDLPPDHTGSEAVVRVDGEVGRSFTVEAAVRQGCVIAPTFFNVFVNHILQAISHSCPPTSNLAFKLLRSQAVHCRHILSLALWHLCRRFGVAS
eukprot:354078-Chlamydomonas_euryale.AAC.5